MMVFWLVCALMTVGVIVALTRPLSARDGQENDHSVAGQAELAVYRDQLHEIEADKARGLISGDEAEAARAEVGRRLLAEASRLEAAHKAMSATADRRANDRGFYGIAAAIPTLSLLIYLSLGSPGLPGVSVAERSGRSTVVNADIVDMVARVEAQLRANPSDGAGWDVIAAVYLRLERFREAADAFQRAIDQLGATPRRLAGLADATVLAADGIVTEAARRAYEKMLQLEPGRPEARFGLALAKEQDGDLADAEAAYKALLAEAPPDAPWLPLIHERIQAVAARRTGTDTAEGIAKMAPADRASAMMQMVEGLEARLKSNGRDLEGWQRLLRSWVVLGNKERAKDALADARKAMAGDAKSMSEINSLAKSLGLDS